MVMNNEIEHYTNALDELRNFYHELDDNIDNIDNKKKAMLSLIRFIESQKNSLPLPLLTCVLRHTIRLVTEDDYGEQYLQISKKIEKKYKALGEKMAWIGATFILLAVLSSLAAVGSIALPLTTAGIMIPVIGFLVTAFVLGLAGLDKADTSQYIAENEHPLATHMNDFKRYFFKPLIADEKEIELLPDYQYQ